MPVVRVHSVVRERVVARTIYEEDPVSVVRDDIVRYLTIISYPKIYADACIT